MRNVTVLSALFAVGFAVSAQACDNEAKVAAAVNKPACCQKALAGAVANVMETLPAMSYRAGDLDTHCLQTAVTKAGDPDKVQYVVAKKAYGSETEAVVALAELLEGQIAEMSKMQFSVGGKSFHCPMSAKAACKGDQKVKYRLAGVEFDSMEKAQEAMKRVNSALNGDAVVAKVGCNKPCGSSLAAAKADAKPGCDKSKKAAAVAAASKPGCDKSKKAAAVAAAGKPGCGKAKQANAQVAAVKSGCDKTKRTAQLAAKAEGPPACCKKAQERLATVQGKIRTMVETAAEVALSS